MENLKNNIKFFVLLSTFIISIAIIYSGYTKTECLNEAQYVTQRIFLVVAVIALLGFIAGVSSKNETMQFVSNVLSTGGVFYVLFSNNPAGLDPSQYKSCKNIEIIELRVAKNEKPANCIAVLISFDSQIYEYMTNKNGAVRFPISISKSEIKDGITVKIIIGQREFNPKVYDLLLNPSYQYEI